MRAHRAVGHHEFGIYQQARSSSGFPPAFLILPSTVNIGVSRSLGVLQQ
jgi:hypothetical protein